MLYNALTGFGAHVHGAAAFVANAVTFEDTSSQHTSASSLTGATSNKTFSFSVWLKPEALDATWARVFQLLDTGSIRIQITVVGTTDVMNIRAADASGNLDLHAQTSVTLTDGTWTHLCGSFDMANSANRAIVFDGTEDTSVTWTTYNDDTIDWAGVTDGLVAASSGGGSTWDGCIAELWVTNEYLDFQVAGNVEKFRTSGGAVVDLGNDGSTPTGTAAIYYFSDPAASYGTNSGTGGNFTIQNGALANCADAPPTA